jgi:hypothetical protein
VDAGTGADCEERRMIAVVHLVWGPLGPRPLREFLASHRRHPAGVEHELVMLFNNVSAEQRPALLAELDGFEHRLLELDAPAQDLAAYAQAAKRLEHERICFLNSYSEILIDGWLEALNAPLERPEVGLVGATGSWASLHSAVLNAFLLPNPYRGVIPKRSIAREQMRAIELELELVRVGAEDAAFAELPSRSLRKSVVSTLKAFRPMPEQLLRFEPFPAHHLRTNAFMLDRSTFNAFELGRIERKSDAYLLESGRNSFTRQVQRQGKRVLVVARDGSSYDQDRWPASRTLWQGQQEGLLVADNQTRSYINGNLDRRRLLSAFAWGRQSDPSAPNGAVG